MGVYNAGYVKLGCSLMVNDILNFHNTTLSFDNLEISRVCKKNLDIGIISLQNRVLDTKTWFLGKTRLTIKINIKNHLP